MENPLPSLAVLPIGEEAWLCRCRGPEVHPLAEVPGTAEARIAFAPDGSTFAVLGPGGKRAGLFRLLDEAPWIEGLLPFSDLPKGCIGHTIAAAGGSLIVGGRSRAFESLWQRSQGTGGRWEGVPLPNGIGARGKAIDALLLQGSRLIAVDDLLSPKWVVVYRLDDAGSPHEPAAVRLPEHIAYERICAAALGPRWIALISTGISHGSKGAFLSLLDRDSFKEQAVWSARRPGGLFDAGRPEDLGPIDLALLDARDLAFAGETLLIACGSRGMLSADLAGWTPPPPEPAPEVDAARPPGAAEPGPALVHRSVPGLASVEQLVVPQPQERTGVFAIGRGTGGGRSSRWVPCVL